MPTQFAHPFLAERALDVQRPVLKLNSRSEPEADLALGLNPRGYRVRLQAVGLDVVVGVRRFCHGLYAEEALDRTAFQEDVLYPRGHLDHVYVDYVLVDQVLVEHVLVAIFLSCWLKRTLLRQILWLQAREAGL
jgi:hypothetical protein